LTAQALPPVQSGKLDRAAAPRRALVVTLQTAIAVVVGAPIVALTLPFVSPVYGPAILIAGLAVLFVAFWRSATNLEGHVRAGAEMVVEVLAKESHDADEPTTLESLHPLLPGLGTLASAHLGKNSPSVGKSLTELDLRALTGASVIAIHRGGEDVVTPTGHEKLREGDVLALIGTREALAAAQRLLLTGSAEPA
jgi:CPA2 family monovalent cation:H+ antiporter-2